MNSEAGRSNAIPATQVSWASRLITNPVYGITTGIATLVGVPLSIYLFFASQQFPEITYLVNPIRTSIVASHETSGLTVLYGDRPIRGDLSAAQVSIWNAGSRPIQAADVLQPIVLYVKDAPIVDVKVSAVSRQLTGLSIDRSQIAEGKVGLSWRVLEKNDGVRLQLIYEGPPNAEVGASGAIIGQPAINQRLLRTGLTASHNNIQREIKREALLTLILLLLSATILLGLYLSIRSFSRARFQQIPTADRTFFIVTSAVFFGLDAVLIILTYHDLMSTPPLGF